MTPSHADALEPVRLLQRQRRPEEALQLLLNAGWPSPDPAAWLLRGQLEHQLGLYSDAVCSLAMAAAEPSLARDASYHLAEAQRSLGQFDQAAAWFLAALRHDPEHRFSHNSLQFTRFSATLLPRVIEAYRALVAAAPQQPFPRQLLAHYVLRSGDTAQATAINRQASRLQSRGAELLLEPADPSATLPAFLVLGVPKGGTSSLLAWLATHPQLWCHPRKELHFFDLDWQHGPDWYASHFPPFHPEALIRCGEATPNYFQLPEGPERVRALLPQARLIVLLRDPLQRALSWLQHLRRYEGLQGDPATLLLQECDQLEQLQNADPAAFEASGFRWPNALLGSCYNAPLRRWQAAVPPGQLLVLRSEQLFATPQATLQQIAAFLGVAPQWPWGDLPPFNVSPQPPPPLPAELCSRLELLLQRHSAWALSQAVVPAAADGH